MHEKISVCAVQLATPNKMAILKISRKATFLNIREKFQLFPNIFLPENYFLGV